MPLYRLLAKKTCSSSLSSIVTRESDKVFKLPFIGFFGLQSLHVQFIRFVLLVLCFLDHTSWFRLVITLCNTRLTTKLVDKQFLMINYSLSSLSRLQMDTSD